MGFTTILMRESINLQIEFKKRGEEAFSPDLSAAKGTSLARGRGD
jgi:hypothetical protein